jgi:hypothetical protein
VSLLPWRNDEERIESVARGSLPAALEIIDVPALEPERHRVARFVGKCIGIATVYAVAGLIWSWRGAAWAARRARAWT